MGYTYDKIAESSRQECEQLHFDAENTWQEYLDLKRQADDYEKAYCVAIEKYRRKSANRVLEWLTHNVDKLDASETRKYLTHVMNKLNGSIDGVELTLGVKTEEGETNA